MKQDDATFIKESLKLLLQLPVDQLLYRWCNYHMAWAHGVGMLPYAHMSTTETIAYLVSLVKALLQRGKRARAE